MKKFLAVLLLLFLAAPASATVLIQEGWESGWNGWEHVYGEAQIVSGGHTGSYCLRYTVRPGYEGNSPDIVAKSFAQQSEVYGQFWVRHSSNWAWPSIQDKYVFLWTATSDYNAFIGTSWGNQLTFSSQTPSGYLVYAPYGTYHPGSWDKVTFHATAGSAGSANGSITIWVNDVQVLSYSNVPWRPSGAGNFYKLALEMVWGGPAGDRTGTYTVDYDDIILQTTPIGGGGGDPIDQTPPYVDTATASPQDGATGVSVDTTSFALHVKDAGAVISGLPSGNVSMNCGSLGGTTTITGTTSDRVLTRSGFTLAYDQNVSCAINATDNAGNVMPTFTYNFIVEPDPTPSQGSAPYPLSSVITQMSWDFGGVVTGATGSDLWPVTWGPDNNIYTSFGDGGGFGGDGYLCRTNLGIATLTGTPTSFTPNNLYGCLANGSGCDSIATHSTACNADYASQWTNGTGWGDDLIYVDGTLYLLVSKWPSNRIQFAYSTNGGHSFTELGWYFETGTGKFIPTGFLQFGQNYAGARDTYFYIIGYKDGTWDETYLARVPKASIATQGDYQYYTSTNPASPTWGTWANAKPIHSNSNDGYGGHMVYLPALQRYLLTQFHGADSVGAADLSKLGVYDAPEPWGPWTTAYFTEDFGGYGSAWGYWLSFVQKWASADNKTLYATFSGDGDFDKFMLLKATLQTAPSPTLTITTDNVLASAQVGSSAPITLEGTGGTTPYSWSVVSGSLPSGRTLSSGGVISGTYTDNGAFTFTVRMTDAASRTVDKAFTQSITPLLPAGQYTKVWTTEIQDTFINSGSTGSNYSTEDYIEVYTWPGGVAANIGFLKVPYVSMGLPANIDINEGTLTLRVSAFDGSGGTNPLRVYAYKVTGMTQGIDNVTWANFDGTLTLLGYYDVPLGVTEFNAWNILSAVREAYAAEEDLIIALGTGTGGAVDSNRMFYSVDSGSIRMPSIVVRYTQLSSGGTSTGAPGKFSGKRRGHFGKRR